jgi:hypothetical protein
MAQHPKVTVGWTVACLELALRDLGDTPAERRVRRQFHQLVLALERDGHLLVEPRVLRPQWVSWPGRAPRHGASPLPS